jgi:serine/threonine protein kinase
MIRPELQIGAFTFDGGIGPGAFRSVWKAHHTASNHSVAITIIPKGDLDAPLAQARFQRGLSLLKQTEHPLVSAFFQFLEDRENVYLVMEFVGGGSLRDLVANNGRLPEEQARYYFVQLICALEYVHNQTKVSHCDVRCESVLLDGYGNIRLNNRRWCADVNPELQEYSAPEVIQGHPCTQAADIWSAGVLLFFLVAGYLPFNDEVPARLFDKVLHSEIEWSSSFSPQLTDLLNQMLCKVPDQRISLEMIQCHAWFSQTQHRLLLYAIRSSWSAEGVIQTEIVDTMKSYGIDCHELPHSLIMAEYTDQTALYRIIRRLRVIESMKDLMQTITMPPAPASYQVQRGPFGKRMFPLVRPHGGPALLGRPTSVIANPVAAGRRSSRPVILKPLVQQSDQLPETLEL